MEYDINLDATWKRLKPNLLLELKKRSEKAAKWVSNSSHDLSRDSREMQMIPVYLELATNKGKPRFNLAEITELCGSLKVYKSKISSTDLVKQLLNIGVDKGEPLSVKEMKDFLSTTALMNKNEQINIIKFIKALKEGTEIIPKGCYPEKNMDKNDLIQYKSYTSKANIKPTNISNFINLNNLEFAYGITRCRKPETLANIAKNMGAMWEISVVPNDLVKAYELSNGNMALIEDLLRGFYPWEIENIVSKLSEKSSSADLSKYKNKTVSTDYVTVEFSSKGISDTRKIILDKLGLTGEIDLTNVDYSRKIRTIDGSFEQGKRR